MRILDLHEPPPEEPAGSPRRLRLVPKGPPITFRRPEDPVAPWYVKLVSTFLGAILSILGLSLILLTAAVVKSVYDRMDALDRARAEQRAKAQAEREAAEAAKERGAILLSLPQDPNARPLPPAALTPGPAPAPPPPPPRRP